MDGSNDDDSDTAVEKSFDLTKVKQISIQVNSYTFQLLQADSAFGETGEDTTATFQVQFCGELRFVWPSNLPPTGCERKLY